MEVLKKIGVTLLFYAPVGATWFNPIMGLGVTTLMVIWHYRHQPFKRALDQLVPETLDPREVIQD